MGEQGDGLDLKVPAQRSRDRGPQSSFSLIETLIAVSMMVVFLLEFAGVQGRSVDLAEEHRQRSQATWLGRAVMAKIEWGSQFYPLKDFASAAKTRDQPFDEVLCPSPGGGQKCDYTYSVNVEEWGLGFADLVVGAVTGGFGPKDDSSSGGDGSPIGDLIRQLMKTIFGDDVLKIAHVEVFWDQGGEAKARPSLELALLLANQKALNTFLMAQSFTRSNSGSAPTPPSAAPGGGGAPNSPGVPPAAGGGG